MKTLYYLSYNNYYNRLLKRKETVAEYLADEAIPCGESVNVNFFPNDGITTTHTPYLNDLNDIPDYVLVIDNGVIESRWFVTECRYNTGKTQYVCSLYRDLIAEYWPQIVNKPFYCEKGWLPIIDNGIFNDEAITTNQIKRKEYPLKDRTQMPWIVGYYAKRAESGSNLTVTYDDTTITPDITVNNISDWQYNNWNVKYVEDYCFSFYAWYDFLWYDEMWHIRWKRGKDYSAVQGDTKFKDWKLTGSYWTQSANIGSALTTNPNFNTVDYDALFNGYYNTSTNLNEQQTIRSLSGKIIYEESTQKYYKVFINETSFGESWGKVDINSTLGQEMKRVGENLGQFFGIIRTENLETVYSGTQISVELAAAQLDKGSIQIRQQRRELYDAPYCMFAIPYGRFVAYDANNSIAITTSSIDSLNIATAISRNASSFLYDIQLLPFCPIEKIRNSSLGLAYEISDLVEGQDYEIARNDSGALKGIIFWCDFSSGSFTIDTPILDRQSNSFDNWLPSHFKTKCQTEFWRLCSPNYNGVFEFSPFKNRGVDYFQVNYTYKPYQPFIQVAPNFKGLYGGVYNDARGLILGGDFSLTRTENAFATYELQNKNYQEMFNRQIENMEVQHKYQRRQEVANAITGTLTGGVTGGIAGSTAGPWGAVAGAAIGTVASGIGGGLDIQAGKALRAEALDYTKDLFGYQLDNIKALPNSLTRVSALNNINKLFPFIEVYDCTTEEYRAVKNKIIYNGMTVERIGTISEFLITNDWTRPEEPGYIKGKLIRFEGVAEDSHTITALSNELNKGVFVKWEFNPT